MSIYGRSRGSIMKPVPPPATEDIPHATDTFIETYGEDYKNIFNSVREGIALFDRTGKIIKVNKRILDISGYKEEEIVGKRLQILGMFPPKSIAKMTTNFAKLISGKQVPTFEVEVVTKTGEQLDVELYGTPIKKNNKIVGMVGVIRDITERKQAKEKEHEFIEKLLFLSKTATDLVQFPLEGDILHYAGEKLQQIAKNTYITISLFDEKTDTFKISEVAGYGKHMKTVLKLLKRNPVGMELPLHNTTWRKKLLKGTMIKITEDEFKTLILPQMPRSVSLGISKIINIDEIYLMPLTYEKTLFGFVFLTAHKGSKLENIDIIETFINQVSVVCQRQNVEEVVHRKMSFENLLSTLSSRFITLDAEEIDENINDALRQFSELAGVDRSYVNLFKGGSLVVRQSYEYCKKGLKPFGFVGLSFEPYQWAYKKLSRFEYIIVEDVDTLPKEAASEKELWKKGGVKSIAGIPLVSQDTLIGFMGFSTESSAKRWTETDLRFFRLLGEDIATILEKKNAEESLKKSEKKYRTLIETLHEGIWQIDEHAVTTYVNKRMAEMLGYTVEEMVGKHLFSFMDGKGKKIAKQDLERRKQGIKEQHEFEFIRKDGTRLYALVETAPIVDEQETYRGAVAGVQDISSQKKAEKEIKESEERYRNIVAMSPYGIAIADMKGMVTAINPAFVRLTGFSEEEIVGRHFSKIPTILKEDLPKYIPQATKLLLGTKEKVSLDFRWKRKNGDIRFGEAKLRVMKVGKKKIGIQAILRDITDEKAYEKKLRESEEKYRSVVENTNEGIVITQDGMLMYANAASSQVSGYSNKELLSRPFLEIVHPDDRTMVKEIHTKRLQGKETLNNYDMRILDKHGNSIWLRNSGVRIEWNGKPATLNFLSNITEQKTAEEALRQSEKKFRTIAERSKDAIVIADTKGKITYVSPAVNQMAGYSVEECVGKSFFHFLRKSEIPKVMKEYRAALKEQRATSNFPLKLKHKNGTTIYGEISATPIVVDGKAVGTQGIIRDVTRQKLLQEQEQQHMETLSFLLQTSTEFVQLSSEKDIYNMVGEHLRSLVEDAYLIISSFDENEKTFTIRKLIGLELHMATILNILGQPLTGVTLHLDTDSWYKKMVAGKLIQTSLNEMINVTSSSIPRQLHGVVETYINSEQIYTVGIYYNNRLFGNVIIAMKKGYELQHKEVLESYINQASMAFQRKQMDDELREAHQTLSIVNKELERKVEDRTAEIERLLKQKDEFVNQLGHDLKNPLTPLVTLIPIIKRRQTDKKTKDLLGVIEENVRFMKNLVTKTIELARLNAPSTMFDVKPINLYEKVGAFLNAQQSLFDEKSLTVENLISKDIVVEADDLQLNELFNNILNNAIKYTPEQGTVTLDAQEDDDMVTISVTDTGAGMTEDQLRQVFDEFYKVDPSRHDFDSSGLGLAISKRIVEKHGGRIWADSKGKGKGTTFYFTLKQGTEST